MTAILEAENSGKQAEDEEDAAAEEEVGDSTRAAPDAGRPGDKRGDTTESSDGGAEVGEGGGEDDDGARAATGVVPSAGSDSDSAAYRDEDRERGAPPLVSSSRGKSTGLDVAEQVGGDGRVVVDLSSGSEPDSEGSSSVPASKPAVSSCRTKELEAAARKA